MKRILVCFLMLLAFGAFGPLAQKEWTAQDGPDNGGCSANPFLSLAHADPYFSSYALQPSG